LLYKHIDLINPKMIKISNIKFFDTMKLINYNKNDLYMLYYFWYMVYWYMEEKERYYIFWEKC